MIWLFISFTDHSLFYLGDPFDLGLQEYDRSKTITKYIKALSSDILDFTIFCNAALWLPFLLLFGLRAVKRQLSTKRNVSMISLNQTSKRSPCICEFLEEKVCTELALVIPLFSGGSCYRLQRSLITRFSWLTKWFFVFTCGKNMNEAIWHFVTTVQTIWMDVPIVILKQVLHMRVANNILIVVCILNELKDSMVDML